MTRFLVDAQRPPALSRWLVEMGHEAEHVIDCGLESSDDRLIWQHALRTNSVIVTKDEDFATRRAIEGSGPSMIWVRIGNASRRETLRWFAAAWPNVIEALKRGDTLVEIT